MLFPLILRAGLRPGSGVAVRSPARLWSYLSQFSLLRLLLTHHHLDFELVFALKTSFHSTFGTHHLIRRCNMLSTRGEAYAKAGLADGYLGPRNAHFDKDTKQGVVSFSNAENVSQP